MSLSLQIVVADCQCVLGRVHARRGDLANAEAAFRSAAETARDARMPLLELVAGRELKQHVPTAAEAGDAIIDDACSRMGKARAMYGDLLAFRVTVPAKHDCSGTVGLND